MMPHRMSSMTIRTSRAVLVALTFQSVAAPSAMGLTGRPCPGPLFENPEYCMVTRPFSVATGDLDGDGNLDLVAGRRQSPSLPNSIVVRFGRGDNTFGDMATYDGGVEVSTVAIGDLDADGDLDMNDAAAFQRSYVGE